MKFKGQEGGYSHAMFLNDGPPIYGGRELWGFPKKYAQPCLSVDKDTLIGTLNYGSVRVATATMGFKHKALDQSVVRAGLEKPNYLLKIIPHVDGTPRILELIDYRLEDIVMKGLGQVQRCSTRAACAGAGCRTASARSSSATHIIADLTLGLGNVVYDYRKPEECGP